MDAVRHQREGSCCTYGERTRVSGYRRHRPEDTVLYGVVEQHAETFFDEHGERGGELPRFVREEFAAYLRCGRLEHGFVRTKCTGCRYEHLVAFSCKRRGWCPSCASRRMAETGAHLVDNVLPHTPYRQWVLSFPWPLRLLFAARPQWLTRVLGVVTRALSAALLKRAGVRHCEGARTGMVTFIQRFGSKLNLNVHLHILALDGAYTFAHGTAHFHRAPAPGPDELGALLSTLITRITRTLVHCTGKCRCRVAQGCAGAAALACWSPSTNRPTSTCRWTRPTSSWPARRYATSSPPALRLGAPPCAYRRRCWAPSRATDYPSS